MEPHIVLYHHAEIQPGDFKDNRARMVRLNIGLGFTASGIRSGQRPSDRLPLGLRKIFARAKKLSYLF